MKIVSGEKSGANTTAPALKTRCLGLSSEVPNEAEVLNFRQDARPHRLRAAILARRSLIYNAHFVVSAPFSVVGSGQANHRPRILAWV
jgi:hypothetical protein